MIKLKTAQEIAVMAQGGKILRGVVSRLIPLIKAGTTTNQIDQAATRLIKKNGADLSFNKVPGYRWATCLPVNEQVVHTPPGRRVLKEGDVLTIDIGCFYGGFHTDYATTVIVGTKKNDQAVKFLSVGEQTLEKALSAVKIGHYLGEISLAIEKEIYGHGYCVIKDLTGHGIGRSLHEDPYIPGFVDGSLKKTVRISAGMVLAIEVIYSKSSEKISRENGGWSLISADRSLSACFEKTIAVTQKNTVILT